MWTSADRSLNPNWDGNMSKLTGSADPVKYYFISWWPYMSPLHTFTLTYTTLMGRHKKLNPITDFSIISFLQDFGESEVFTQVPIHISEVSNVTYYMYTKLYKLQYFTFYDNLWKSLVVGSYFHFRSDFYPVILVVSEHFCVLRLK